MFTSLNNELFRKKNFFIIFFFFILFLLGVTIFDDYGIAFDEDIQRSIGLSNYDYVSKIFQNEKIDIYYPHYGIAFELPLVFLEKIFGINSIENIYLFRHFLIFLTTVVGHIVFFLLLKKQFGSIYLSLFGSFILIISPRFFAESFYNSKDIIFMHSFIICVFFGIKFLERPDLANSFLFALTSAMSANIRLAGLLVPLFIFYFILIKFLRNDYKYQISFKILINLLFLLFLVVIFWPYLWSNPFDNFLNSFFVFKNYDIDLINFYAGKYVPAKIVDWYYLPLWISVTTPFYILFFFFINFFRTVRRAMKRLIMMSDVKKLNDLWRGERELYNLIFLSIIFISLFLSVIFNSTLYGGWRHFYFIYPFIIILAISEIRFFTLFFKKFRVFLFFLLFICILFQIKWMFVNHPHQNVYFNFIGGNKSHLNYEVDYWGLSNKYALEKILSSKKESETISISNISDTNLVNNLLFLKLDGKDKIIYKDVSEKPDFLIDNNYFFNPMNKKRRRTLNDYSIFDQLYVGDILVTTIYKKK
jgi:hypothetical protein